MSDATKLDRPKSLAEVIHENEIIVDEGDYRLTCSAIHSNNKIFLKDANGEYQPFGGLTNADRATRQQLEHTLDLLKRKARIALAELKK